MHPGNAVANLVEFETEMTRELGRPGGAKSLEQLTPVARERRCLRHGRVTLPMTGLSVVVRDG